MPFNCFSVHLAHLLRILVIPITDSGFIRSPDLPNTSAWMVSL